MNKIIALWCTPRSTSTAFEWMMRQRGDLYCMHEPFGEAWYQGEEPLWPRYKDGDKTTPGLTLESVWNNMQKLAKKHKIFFKDFPHYISHIWNNEFLSHFTHCFLIRDPAKTLTSIYNKWPDFSELEVGFPEQRALFDLISAINGKHPPVIDSDDLLERPKEMTKIFCGTVGIPFIEEALTWKVGSNLSQYSWWDGGSFHSNLSKSTGLKSQQRNYVKIQNAPIRVQSVYRRMMPHYQHLYKFRLH